VTNSHCGQLSDGNGNPLTIHGLGGLRAGNGGSAGSTQAIDFSAGPGDAGHGLFGLIAPVPESGTLALLGFGLAPTQSLTRTRLDVTTPGVVSRRRNVCAVTATSSAARAASHSAHRG